MARTKRNKLQREDALEEVARLRRQGYAIRAIAAKMGVSHVQVHYDLKIVMKRLVEACYKSRQAAVNDMVEMSFDVIRENWQAWQNSKQDTQTVIRETTLTGPRSRTPL